MSPSLIGWVYEDELPEDYPYDDLYPYSKVDVVRMFPPLEFTQVLQEHAKLTKALGGWFGPIPEDNE